MQNDVHNEMTRRPLQTTAMLCLLFSVRHFIYLWGTSSLVFVFHIPAWVWPGLGHSFGGRGGGGLLFLGIQSSFSAHPSECVHLAIVSQHLPLESTVWEFQRHSWENKSSIKSKENCEEVVDTLLTEWD